MASIGRGNDSPKFAGCDDDNTRAVAAPKCTRVGRSVGGLCVGIGPSASTGEPLGRSGSFCLTAILNARTSDPHRAKPPAATSLGGHDEPDARGQRLRPAAAVLFLRRRRPLTLRRRHPEDRIPRHGPPTARRSGRDDRAAHALQRQLRPGVGAVARGRHQDGAREWQGAAEPRRPLPELRWSAAPIGRAGGVAADQSGRLPHRLRSGDQRDRPLPRRRKRACVVRCPALQLAHLGPAKPAAERRRRRHPDLPAETPRRHRHLDDRDQQGVGDRQHVRDPKPDRLRQQQLPDPPRRRSVDMAHQLRLHLQPAPPPGCGADLQPDRRPRRFQQHQRSPQLPRRAHCPRAR